MTQVAIQLPEELSQFVNATVQAGDSAKLASLRADIQLAVDQADRGEVIRDFNMDTFLAERHREHASAQDA